jgi:tetraacyldisaccharide 4'-kinase
MPWYAFFLAPVAFIFHGITAARNFLFDKGWIKSEAGPVPTLVIGNLAVGGTGKTPWVAYLTSLLKQEVELALLSRGYGRKSKGFLQAKADTTAEQLGDEPLQLWTHFQGEVPVFVGEDRVAALKRLHEIIPKTRLVLLDDALQHRRLRPQFTLLLTTYLRPFYQDFLLPMGRLREARSGAKRADIVVVTKCPMVLDEEEKNQMKRYLAPYLGEQTKVLFSSLRYGQPYQIHGPKISTMGEVIALAGLADNLPFFTYCRSTFSVLETLSYPDHHAYGEKEASKIAQRFTAYKTQGAVLLTTEKDAVKLKSPANSRILQEIPIFVLPIEVVLDPKEQEALLQRLRKTLLCP